MDLSTKINISITLFYLPRPTKTYQQPKGDNNMIIVNLCNRTGEERRSQTLCEKRDNNFI